MGERAERWRPYRSYATLYLWRLHGAVVEPVAEADDGWSVRSDPLNRLAVVVDAPVGVPNRRERLALDGRLELVERPLDAR